MEQFTANEVRRQAKELFAHNAVHQHAMLNAFADILEAQEKAVPVAWSLIFEESIGVNAPTTFDRREDAEDYADACAMPDKRNPFPHRPKVVPLYIHPAPSDTERLAEVVRNCIRDLRIAAEYGKTMRNPKALLETVESAEAALAAHSAQAQPPAASVTDAMKRAFEHLASIGYPKNARGNYDKDGEWTFSDAVPRDVDAREVSAAFHALKAAIAAQENPNG